MCCWQLEYEFYLDASGDMLGKIANFNFRNTERKSQRLKKGNDGIDDCAYLYLQERGYLS